MPKRLTDRYDVDAIRFTRAAPQKALARDLLGVVDSIRPGGSVFYILCDTPEDSGDEISVLIDGDTIIHFELPRLHFKRTRVVGGPPTDIQIESLEEFRKRIGQGRRRLLLDRAVDDAHRHRA
ncbi:hypothetical protein [Novosphingobium nitrogenifigens]|uniref:hypothetical protein n=1 Tax=Novosphingobium nitrogenifigens TaxID=378548 RepID=UPI00036E83B0|nr:hypothetical protein [Novosphingobium nitrogenifigens]